MTIETDHLSAWIDEEEVVDVDIKGREIGLRAGPIELCAPLGVATWQTGAEIRGFRWRSLENTGNEAD